MQEVWKPVVGYENSYEVSDLGRVRSIDRICPYQRRDQYSGRILSIARVRKGVLLRPGVSESGHLIVVLGRGNTRLKLRNADIPVIRALFGKLSCREIGERYGVNYSTIRQIKDGRTWKHVGTAK